MDTAKLGHTAEDLIASQLQRADILVAKPKFDRDGADLLGLLNVNDGARFCRIQCKGRTIGNSGSNNVTISPKYVSNAFVVCLFVETGDTDTTNLFVFFGSEIEDENGPWTLGKKKNGDPVFRLDINEPRLNEWEKYRLNESRTGEIKHLIRNANVTGEFAHLFAGQADITIGAANGKASGNFTL